MVQLLNVVLSSWQFQEVEDDVSRLNLLLLRVIQPAMDAMERNGSSRDDDIDTLLTMDALKPILMNLVQLQQLYIRYCQLSKLRTNLFT